MGPLLAHGATQTIPLGTTLNVEIERDTKLSIGKCLSARVVIRYTWTIESLFPVAPSCWAKLLLYYYDRILTERHF